MDPITVGIVVGAIVSVVSGIIIGLLNRRWKKKDDKKAKEEADYKTIKKQIELLRKAVWRQNKTILIMAKLLDDQVEKSHPELNSALEDIASELLKESNGA